MFADRTDAGEQLAAEMRRREIPVDVVLAIPRGGLPVARPVADALGVPLDVVVAKKIGAPSNPELAVAAVADDGTLWRNESIIGSLDLTEAYLEDARHREQEAAREKADRYRGDRPPLDLTGKRVAVVDDGLATGATMRACIERAREAGAASLVVAVPVGSPDTVAEIARAVDDVVALDEPGFFGAVGQFYRNFDQVSDEDAMALLS